MNPTALRYYVLMGLLLGVLWRRRGLLASMSAHAAFNAVLTVAAVAATTGSGQPTAFGQLTFTLPGGWHPSATGQVAGRLVVQGPAGAGLALVRHPNPGVVPTTAQLLAHLVDVEGTPGSQLVAGSEQAVRLPAGDAVEADVVVSGQPGHLVELVAGSDSYELLVVTAGSPAAERDWQRIVASLTVGPG